jgi:hypothetical protein
MPSRGGLRVFPEGDAPYRDAPRSTVDDPMPLWPLTRRESLAPTPREARRIVVLAEGRSPSGDYLLGPWLAARGLPLVHLDSREHPAADALREGDLVVLVRYAPAAWRRALQRRRAALAGLAYFMDDDLLDASAHAGLAPPYARKLGTLAASQRRWLEAHVDAFWVSTPALAAKYASLRPQLIPLAPPPALLAPRAAVRIAYHGTASHGAEIEWLHAVVAGVQARCPHTEFELFGEHPVHRRYRELPRVAVLHPMRWENYLAYTATHPAAIGLAPLLPGPFNAARGAVKFYDYARMGAAGVYTDAEPYRATVRDGVDGVLLPNDPQRWIDTLVALARPDDPTLARLREGVRAHVAALGAQHAAGP